MRLYAHPFSSYCQKALIAFYENDTPFDYRNLQDPAANAELADLWPLKKFPVLVDADRTVVEATSIIEHLAIHHPGPVALIPADPALAVEVRMMDRIFDNYVSSTQQAFIYDALRPEADRDPIAVAQAGQTFDILYPWLDTYLAGREWAVGDSFTLADCAAAPSLFYADWTRRIPARYANLTAYRARLLARPSMARCVEEARKYRSYFPLGAPDRD
ncbi:glutathione S-transferase family protein [soil metagenome]